MTAATTATTAEPMTSHTAGMRLLFGGAALAALVLTSCSSDSGKSASTFTSAVVQTSSAPTAPAPTTIATAGTTAAPTSTIAPLSLLQQAVDAVATSHHFHLVVTVNGTQSVVADGDQVGAASRTTLQLPAGTVNYITTADGSWAQPEGGDWSLLTVPPATTDPIAALKAPTSVSVSSNDGTTTVLAVAVNARSLGITIDGDVTVTVTIAGGAITQIGYTAPIQGGTAEEVTTISPVTDATPIVAPI